MKSRELARQRRAVRRVERRRERQSQRAASTPLRAADSREALVDRLATTYERWQEHRGDVLHDTCPVCSKTVLVKPLPRRGFDLSHAEPPCKAFVHFMIAIGAVSLPPTPSNAG